jgi:hypothetical protein
MHNATYQQRQYPQPTTKQVALFCHLAKILWKLALRIPWARLDPAGCRRVEEVQGMLERTAAKVRLAKVGPDQEGGG